MAFAAVAILCWSFLPIAPLQPDPPLPRGGELLRLARLHVFRAEALPRFDAADESARARLGRQLFFDKALSANGKVACASCHDPAHGYSDQRPRGLGLGEGARRTPSLVNAFANDWFFWDGRADSLAAQALGPIEHPLEHGISRTHVVRHLRDYYRRLYEEAFEPWPASLLASLPDEAKPAAEAPHGSARIAAYTLASLDSFAAMDGILVAARRAGLSPAAMIHQRTNLVPATPAAWSAAWQALALAEQAAINRVFSHFGQALAAFERGLVAVDSPFDRFVERLEGAAGAHEDAALSEGFGADELHGLQLFVGRAGCASCHSGPRFSDQQFHNIGFASPKGSSKQSYLDAGRSVGVRLAKADPFNCLGSFNAGESESCRELPWLDEENLELVGAFKTPGLRNVAERAPYGHDGRFATLAAVLRHYNELDDEAAVGHREETLVPLGLRGKELADLEAFLRSLTAPVLDLTVEP